MSKFSKHVGGNPMAPISRLWDGREGGRWNWHLSPFLRNHFCPKWALPLVTNHEHQACHLVAYPTGDCATYKRAVLTPDWDEGVWSLSFNYIYQHEVLSGFPDRIPLDEAEWLVTQAVAVLMQELSEALKDPK